jgi:hypothetical protein
MLRYAETELRLSAAKEENRRSLVYLQKRCWGPDLRVEGPMNCGLFHKGELHNLSF